MKLRSCSVLLRIAHGADPVREWRLRPLTSFELPTPFVAGYHLSPADPGEPVHVRLALDGAVNCDCPAWNHGESCEHCAALVAAGILPAHVVALLMARTELLDLAERRADQAVAALENVPQAVDADNVLEAIPLPTSPRRRRRG